MSLQAGGKSTIPLKSLSNVEVGLLVAHIAATVLPILSKHYHDFIKCGINGENLCDLEVNEELKEYGITIPLLAFKQFHRLIEAFKKNEVPRHIIDNANTEKPASILMTLETNLVDESGIATLADHRMDASMYHTDESPHLMCCEEVPTSAADPVISHTFDDGISIKSCKLCKARKQGPRYCRLECMHTTADWDWDRTVDQPFVFCEASLQVLKEIDGHPLKYDRRKGAVILQDGSVVKACKNCKVKSSGVWLCRLKRKHTSPNCDDPLSRDVVISDQVRGEFDFLYLLHHLPSGQKKKTSILKCRGPSAISSEGTSQQKEEEEEDEKCYQDNDGYNFSSYVHSGSAVELTVRDIDGGHAIDHPLPLRSHTHAPPILSSVSSMTGSIPVLSEEFDLFALPPDRSMIAQNRDKNELSNRLSPSEVKLAHRHLLELKPSLRLPFNPFHTLADATNFTGIATGTSKRSREISFDSTDEWTVCSSESGISSVSGSSGRSSSSNNRSPIKRLHTRSRSISMPWKVYSIAALRDGRLAVGMEDGSIRVIDSCCLEASFRDYPVHKGPIDALMQLADGSLLSASNDKTLKITFPSAAPGSAPGSATGPHLVGHVDRIRAIAQFPDGRILSGGDDKKIIVWDPVTYKPLYELLGHTSTVLAIRPLAHGQLASSSDNGQIHIWDMHTHTEVRPHLQARSGSQVTCLEELKDGSLVSGSSGSNIRIWDVVTGERKGVLEGHERGIFKVIELQDGRLATCSEDMTIRIWHLDTTHHCSYRCVDMLEGHTKFVVALVQLPDGRLLSGSHDKTLFVWDI